MNAVHQRDRKKAWGQREHREQDAPKDQHGAHLMHQITEVWHGWRRVRVRRRVRCASEPAW